MTDAKNWARITEHFKYSEFFQASKSGGVSSADIFKAYYLARLILEPLRAEIGKPLTITSGKRSAEYNRKKKFSPTSDHLFNQECAAVDVSFADSEINRAAGEWLFRNKLQAIGQLIVYLDEENSVRWIHISLPSRKHLAEAMLATVELPRRYSHYNGWPISRQIFKEDK